jgi:hypothetical protein
MVIRKDEKYYRFFFNENCLQGALMMNDKDNAKSLEEAVRMLRNRKEVSEAFS